MSSPPPNATSTSSPLAASRPADSSSSPLINSDPPTDSSSKASPRDEKDSKSIKRRLFPFGKKKDDNDNNNNNQQPGATPMAQPDASLAGMRAASPPKHRPADLKPSQAQPIPISAARLAQHHGGDVGVLGTSPSRMRSGSPRMQSPASSEIFERNVQEPIPITLGGELSPAHIPAHVITEDHIPPALEASAQAITSEHLDPDDVEIVMSTSHQPATVPLMEGSTSDLTQLQSPLARQRSEDSEPTAMSPPPLPSSSGGLMPHLEDDTASNYGQLDPTDVKRLSFISFKDIVQSEQNQLAAFGDAGGPPLSSSIPHERAGSPLRAPPLSPASTYSQSLSGGVTTPPPPPMASGIMPIHHNPEQSPVRGMGGLGAANAPPGLHSEIIVETMSQALRKTASGDLSGVRSAGAMSPVSEEDALPEAPRSVNP